MSSREPFLERALGGSALSSPEPTLFILASVLRLRGPASIDSPWSLPKRLPLQGNEQLLPREGHFGKLYFCFKSPMDRHPWGRAAVPASGPIRPGLASQLCHLQDCDKFGQVTCFETTPSSVNGDKGCPPLGGMVSGTDGKHCPQAWHANKPPGR